MAAPTPHLAVLAVHIIGGFVGMYSGLVPLFTRKGGKVHRTWRLVFTDAFEDCWQRRAVIKSE